MQIEHSIEWFNARLAVENGAELARLHALADERFGCDRRLIVYGSLAPGRANSHVLESVRGEWLRGRMRARIVESGWGVALGYAGASWDAAAELMDAWLFVSPELPHHWARLDEFEGQDYVRLLGVFETGTSESHVAYYYSPNRP